jgi:hypothetical protein
MTIEQAQQELKELESDSDEIIESVKRMEGQENLVKKLETIRDGFKALTPTDIIIMNSLQD